MDPPDFLKELSKHDFGKGLEDLDPTDLVEGFIPNFFFESQLQAIHAILRDGKTARGRLSLALNELNQKSEKQHGLNERDIDYYGELFYEVMYRDSADSLVLSALMSAFLETFFTSLFAEIQKRFASALKNNKWRPKKHKSGVTAGTVEIANAIGLNLPTSFEKIYGALTAYRNATIHNSLKWNESELTKFAEKIVTQGWKEHWFSITKTDDKPSMYALTDLFADELMAAIIELRVAIGKFLETLLNNPNTSCGKLSTGE